MASGTLRVPIGSSNRLARMINLRPFGALPSLKAMIMWAGCILQRRGGESIRSSQISRDSIAETLYFQ